MEFLGVTSDHGAESKALLAHPFGPIGVDQY
jgi:hypothetical protein